VETKYDGPLIIIGQRSVLIPASLIPRNSGWFFKQLIAFLEQQDRDREGYLEIELTAIPYTVPNSITENVEFKLLRVQKRNGYLAGDARLYYSYYTAENTAETGTINIKIHQEQEVALACQDIVRNGSITKEIIEPLACDLATFNQDLLLYKDYATEYTARQHIHKGEFVFLSKIKQDYLVKGGDEVNIVFLNGNMKVVMPGKALEGGIINSLIRIRPYDSKMEFAARIIGPREVLVEID
jgi:flagella basal body P-ring formation protein FlgA